MITEIESNITTIMTVEVQEADFRANGAEVARTARNYPKARTSQDSLDNIPTASASNL